MSKITVIKVGGAILEEKARRERLLDSFLKIQGPKILVHGGGVIANELASKLGLEVSMIDGRRVTDEAMLDVVTMAYGGKISKSIAAYLSSHGLPSIGLTGADLLLIRSRKDHLNPSTLALWEMWKNSTVKPFNHYLQRESALSSLL